VSTPSDRHASRAFTSEKVVALTRLSKRQLQYWDEQGFLSPSLSSRRGKGRRRLYDFRDLVSLRAAADLRREGISLQLIRKVVKHLRELDYASPLAELRFWTSGGRLYFSEAGTIREGRRPAQTIAEIVVPFAEIVRELEESIESIERARAVGKVERRRGALGSKALIAGTRITVESIQRLHADGADEAEILEMYPDLVREDVEAALAQELPPRPAAATG
jgi:DNA-binding transcriptional MerR regulator